MDRREFVENLVSSTVAISLPINKESPPVNPSKSGENPKNLPVAKFKNRICCNAEEIFANQPWLFIDGCVTSVFRRSKCWIPQENKVLWSWGEMILQEIWHEGGSRFLEFTKLPETHVEFTNNQFTWNGVFGDPSWRNVVKPIKVTVPMALNYPLS